MKKQKGFTLIELMITVAIVGILAAIAMTSYNNYIIRSQVTESLSMMGGGKIFVVDYYSSRGTFPADNAAVGYPGGVGKYISDVNIVNGAIVATFSSIPPQSANAVLDGQSLTYTPTPGTDGVITWQCSATFSADYLPSSCK